jgi:hypothetical protein
MPTQSGAPAFPQAFLPPRPAQREAIPSGCATARSYTRGSQPLRYSRDQRACASRSP